MTSPCRTSPANPASGADASPHARGCGARGAPPRPGGGPPPLGLPLGAGARWGYPQRSGARLNRIHGVRQDGTEVFFKIKRKSPLKKLMDVYAQRQGGTTNAYRFIFDGNRIVETQTPDDVRPPPATVTHSATAAASKFRLPAALKHFETF